ncbi:MAG: D-alanyl-D-alanine carboxypeptidase [Maribacter sp.]|nr:D-alanyl-D-alanine carboxypeptidase [Maribacter sp.]
MKKIVVLLLLTFLITGCSTSKRRIVKKIDTQIKSEQYKNQFTGFLIIDPVSMDTIYSINSTRYFIPASNTKIFTLFTSLNLLPDSIPTLKYVIKNDTLIAQGTGDPAVLHPYFNDSTALHFMDKYENIAFYPNNFREEKFGPGWSWDDYHWYYSPERSSLPLYGNVLTIKNTDSLEVHPKYFKDSIVSIDYPVNRELQKNVFYFNPSKKDTVEIPFRVDTNTTKILLEKVLKKKIQITRTFPEVGQQILYGMPSDSVYKRMMQVSDNFLAEQLLILGSSTLSDTLNSYKAREYVLDNQLSDLRQPPRWVDGSGLSRYNLFSPESFVHVLYKMYREIPRERLFLFFPTGGESGTLEDWYPGDQNPYIYAKTGSLGNNHNLSGYLITKSGKTLIFSFMNNHFMESSSEIKKRMQGIFENIRDTY